MYVKTSGDWSLDQACPEFPGRLRGPTSPLSSRPPAGVRGPCLPGTLLSSLPPGPSPFPSLCLHPCPDLWQPLPGSLSPPPAPFASSPPPKDAEIPGPPLPAQPSLRLGAGGDRQHLGPVASGSGGGRDDRYHSVLCFSREQRTKSGTSGLRDLSPTYSHCVCLASPGAGSAAKPRVLGWVLPAPATEYNITAATWAGILSPQEW